MSDLLTPDTGVRYTQKYSSFLYMGHHVKLFRKKSDAETIWGFIECFTTTFLRTHSWLNWVKQYGEAGYKRPQVFAYKNK